MNHTSGQAAHLQDRVFTPRQSFIVLLHSEGEPQRRRMKTKMLMNVGGPSASTVMSSGRVTLIKFNLCLSFFFFLYFYAWVFKMNYTSTSALIYNPRLTNHCGLNYILPTVLIGSLGYRTAACTGTRRPWTGRCFRYVCVWRVCHFLYR